MTGRKLPHIDSRSSDIPLAATFNGECERRTVYVHGTYEVQPD